MVEFYLKLKLILRIIIYLTYICWEIDNFIIKSDIFRRFFICKNIPKKLSCYHDNYFRYFMFGKYNGFVSKARVSACMYFLVLLVKRQIKERHFRFVRFKSYWWKEASTTHEHLNSRRNSQTDEKGHLLKVTCSWRRQPQHMLLSWLKHELFSRHKLHHIAYMLHVH